MSCCGNSFPFILIHQRLFLHNIFLLQGRRLFQCPSSSLHAPECFDRHVLENQRHHHTSAQLFLLSSISNFMASCETFGCCQKNTFLSRPRKSQMSPRSLSHSPLSPQTHYPNLILRKILCRYFYDSSF